MPVALSYLDEKSKLKSKREWKKEVKAVVSRTAEATVTEFGKEAAVQGFKWMFQIP